MSSYSFRWTIGDKPALNPQRLLEDAKQYGADVDSVPMQRVECPRGGLPGCAYFLMRKDDADALLSANAPVDIICTSRVRDDNQDTFTSVDSRTWYSYYPIMHRTVCSANAAANQVVLELRDHRYVLNNSRVAKQYNMAMYKTSSTDVEHYDYETVTGGGSTMWTHQAAFNDLLQAMETPPTLTLPKFATDKPQNLVFNCTLGEAIDQFLASLECALVFNPFESDTTKRYSIVKLEDTQDVSKLDQADNDGRKIADTIRTYGDNLKKIQIKVSPARFNFVESDGTFGGPRLPPVPTLTTIDAPNPNIISIADHYFTTDTSRVRDAVKWWYYPYTAPRDEKYFGVIDQIPGPDITCVAWYQDQFRYHVTHVENLVDRDIPWPEQPVMSWLPAWGVTKSPGLAPGYGEAYYRRKTSAGWEDTTVIVKCWNDGVSSIGGSKRLLFEEMNGRVCAIEVCP